MRNSLLVFLLLHFFSAPSFACDPCALYSASRLETRKAGSFNLSLNEQYTNFDKSRRAGVLTESEQDLVKGFSTTQFAFAYDWSDALSAQFSLPMIGRTLGRLSENDSDYKLGDASLSANYTFLDYQEGDFSLILGTSAGLKLPTGDSVVLEGVSGLEEVEEEVHKEEIEHLDEDLEEDKAHDHSAHEHKSLLFKHHPISASAGRVLTFGSGSYDYIFGANLYSRYKRYLLLSNAQYTIRTEGDFDYEFADDYLFSFGPAYYLLVDNSFTIAAAAILSGEFKAKDKLDGALLPGSQISNYYFGPQLLCTFRDNLSAEFGFDFRISDEDLGASIAPKSRLRLGLAYRF